MVVLALKQFSSVFSVSPRLSDASHYARVRRPARIVWILFLVAQSLAAPFADVDPLDSFYERVDLPVWSPPGDLLKCALPGLLPRLFRSVHWFDELAGVHPLATAPDSPRPPPVVA